MPSKEFSNPLEPSHPIIENDSEQQHIPEIQGDRLAEALRRIEKGYDPSGYFETQLMIEGLLPRLEQARIVPVVENPNPYNPEVDEEQHERWWEEHSQEAQLFEQENDRRNEILKHLYIGALIGSGPWNLP